MPCRSAEHHEQPIRWLVLCPSSLPGPAKPAAGGARLSHTRSSEGLGEEEARAIRSRREKAKSKSTHATAGSTRTHAAGADLLAQRHGRAQPATSRSKERLARPGWQRMIKPDTYVPASPPACPDQGQHRMGCTRWRGKEEVARRSSGRRADRAPPPPLGLEPAASRRPPKWPRWTPDKRREDKSERSVHNDPLAKARGGVAIGQYPPPTKVPNFPSPSVGTGGRPRTKAAPIQPQIRAAAPVAQKSGA